MPGPFRRPQDSDGPARAGLLDRAYPPVRALLFRMDAERAHELTLQTLGRAPELWGRLARLGQPSPSPQLSRTFAGLTVPGPIGLAAGLDKDGVAIPFWPALGFGFVEVGTVTAHPQPGNPRPRLHRLPAERALINRMGFNNHGSEALARRMRALRERGRWPTVPVGANLGKSKVTPNDEAVDDYRTSARRLRGLADYFTINISSPNTPGLRELQDREHLSRLVPAVLEATDAPVFLKLAPDLAPEATAELVEHAISLGISGIIATNTTIRRDLLASDPDLPGGLSGRPLWSLARSRIDTALHAASGRVPVIGVGGIETAEQVSDLLAAGCAAVQLYTALIYEGPGLPARLNRALEDPSP